MNRLRIKITITMVLGVILALLLLNRATNGGKRLLNAPASDAVLLRDDDLQSDMQEALSGDTSWSPLETEATPHVKLPLRRDPFEFRYAYESLYHPEQSTRTLSLHDDSGSAGAELFRLKATVIDRYGALAFINDEVVAEGESILGYTVVRIEAGYVELINNGKKVSLHLEDGGKQ